MLKQLIMTTPTYWRCELLKSDNKSVLRYANELACQLLELPSLSNPDEAIDLYPADVYIKVLAASETQSSGTDKGNSAVGQLMLEMGIPVLEISLDPARIKALATGSMNIDELARGWWQTILTQ